MKLLTLFGFLLSFSTFGGEPVTFTTTDDFTLQSYGRQGEPANVKKSVTISVESFDLYDRSAVITVNGTVKNVGITRTTMHDGKATYKSVVATDIIADGSGCDEAENIKYIATIDGQQNIVTELEATYFYSWDICHYFGSNANDTISYN